MSVHELAGKPEQVIFSVPGSYSEEQLSMLLGIAGACPFTAVGLVDTAVAAAAAVAATGDYQHIDMHLHQTVITRLNVGENVARTAVESIDETGLNKLHTLAAGLIADLFIQQSRFDPLHNAETEQALYNQLPACLRTLKERKETMLEIAYRNATHQAKLSRETLLQKLQPVYSKLREYITPSLPCIISDRMADLPGLIDILPETYIIKPETVFENCRKYEDYIRSSGPDLRFITSLPAADDRGQSEQPAPVKQETTSKIATHILFRNDAYPIGNNIIYLTGTGNISEVEPDDVLCSIVAKNGSVMLTAAPVDQALVNGKPAIQSMEVRPGDRVHSSATGVDYNFIHVVTGNGTRQT